MLIEDLQYSNANALDKIKGAVDKIKDSKALSTAKDLLNKVNTKGASSSASNDFSYTPPPEPKKKKGLSTGAWIGIGAGVLIAGGLIIWIAKK